VSLEIDPGRTPFEVTTNTHQIQLTYRGMTCVLPVDHETFVDPEFFRTLVLHRLEKTIDELAQRG